MLLKKTKLLFLSAFLIFPFLGINSLKLASLSIRKIFDTIPPSAPHGFHGEGGSTIYSIDLYWTNSSDSDLDHVNVYFSNAPLTNYGLYSQIPATPNTKGQATIGSLSLDTDYYFKLSSVDTADNEGEFTDYIKTRTSYAKDVSSPAEVTNFQVADPETGDSLDLSWTDPSDSDFFQVRIYRSTDSWFTPSEDYKSPKFLVCRQALNLTEILILPKAPLIITVLKQKIIKAIFLQDILPHLVLRQKHLILHRQLHHRILKLLI